MGWLVDLIDRIVMGKPAPPEPRFSKEEEDSIMEEFSKNRDRYYYCKCCGEIRIVPYSIQEVYGLYCKFGIKHVYYPICSDCDSRNSFVYSKHDEDYYWNRSKELFGDTNHMHTILFEEEIETNPDFDREKFKLHCQKVAEYKARRERERLDEYMKHRVDTTPRCPTCQSSSIERISATKKVVGAATLGYYSKNAMCQFVCKNCGYKW